MNDEQLRGISKQVDVMMPTPGYCKWAKTTMYALIASLEELQAENEQLRGQLKEWEKLTGYLYAHGIFKEAETGHDER